MNRKEKNQSLIGNKMIIFGWQAYKSLNYFLLLTSLCFPKSL